MDYYRVSLWELIHPLAKRSRPNASKNASGKIDRDVCKLAYREVRDRIKGSRIPPKGMANFISPITVPACSLKSNPAKVMMKGSIAERVTPARKTIR